MKICMLSRSMPAHSVGGMQDHVFTLCKELTNLGHEVTVISTRHPSGITHENIDKINIYYLGNTISVIESRSFRVESLKFLMDLQARLGKFDIIHSQGHCGLHLLDYQRKLGTPLIVSLHGTYIDEIKTFGNELVATLNPKIIFNAILMIVYFSYLHFFIALPRLRKINKVIVTSNEQKKIVERIYHVKNTNLKVVFNGIDAALFFNNLVPSGMRERLGVNKEERVILAVARIVFQKGLQYIISALPGILEYQPFVKLVIVGDGKYRKKLEGLVKRLCLDDYVIFTGFVSPDSLPSYYNICDIFVNPTIRINGYDLSILQAMSCGKPVIASNIGSNPTAITSGVDGLLISPRDEKSMIRQALKILNNKVFAENIGRAAREKILKNFSSTNMALQTLKVYEESISEGIV